MPKDIANIYELDADEFDEIKKDLWKDSFKQAEDTANKIMQEICSLETPYVLSVEANYGMGKTFFFTRFSEFLNKEGISCIYISAWKNDYMPSPFMFISKEIINFFKKSPKIEEFLNKTGKLAAELVSNITLSHEGVQVGFNANQFIKNMSSDEDPIVEFKNELKNKIKKLENKPLVIIVDELDRCRPDYAIKTLEILKHFFSIEGLLFVLPMNSTTLNFAVDNIYNTSDTQNETYIKKLINNNIKMPPPSKDDYETVANTIITKKRLEKAIKNASIVLEDNLFNSFNNIKIHFATYASRANLSYRETEKLCYDFIGYVNHLSNPAHIEYIIYKLISLFKKLPQLSTMHPYRNNEEKNKILSLFANKTEMSKLLNQFDSNFDREVYSEFIKILNRYSFDSFTELKKIIADMKSFCSNNQGENSDFNSKVDKILQYVNSQEKLLIEFDMQYGTTDDKDEEIKKAYDILLKTPLNKNFS